MKEKKRTNIVVELGITDEVALMHRIMINSNVKKVEFIEEDVLQLTYNDGNSWTLISDEIQETEKNNYHYKFN